LRTRTFHFKNVWCDRRPKLVVLTYHRILPYFDDNPLDTFISEKTFIRQIDFVERNYPVISLSEAMDQCRRGEAKRPIQVVLTFDDGYRDSYEVAFPILRRKGLPATFFIVTDYVGKKEFMWDWNVNAILCRDDSIKKVPLGEEVLASHEGETRTAFANRVIDHMKALDIEKNREVLAFLRGATRNGSAAGSAPAGFMTWDEIRELAGSGMEVGAHSRSHRSLSRIPAQEARYEIRTSKGIIEENINGICAHFSFPFGGRQDCNSQLIDSAREMGFRSCLLNLLGYNHIAPDTFTLKRVIVTETTQMGVLLGYLDFDGALPDV